MKHYIAMEVISSGRTRIDVRLEGVEVLTFYPGHMGSTFWVEFQKRVKEEGDMLTLRDGFGSYRLA